MVLSPLGVVLKVGSVQMAQFSEEYIFRTLKIVLMGVLISNLICYFLWPRSAITKLKFPLIWGVADMQERYGYCDGRFLGFIHTTSPQFLSLLINQYAHVR